MEKSIKIIAQFVPILLLFLLLSFSKPFTTFSFSILGKLLAVLVIIFYTYLDKYLGLFVCAIVVLFYQSDYLENMLNIDDILDDIDNYDSSNNESNDLPDDGMYLNNNNTIKNRRNRERMTNQDGVKQEFRERNCKQNGRYGTEGKSGYHDGGQLVYKDMSVKSEYAEHVFPQLEFKDEPCNPCNESCNFSIIESKLNAEKSIIPISTSQ